MNSKIKLTILGHTLDKEQTKAALTNKVNTLIIAGAGSGKSLTMVGKIKYLVKYQNIKLDEILCLTFTNEASKSLELKIKQELNLDYKVYTFHKLALEIIKNNNLNYIIAPSDLLKYLIDEIFSSLINKDYFKHLFFNQNYENSYYFENYKKIIHRFISLYIANFYDTKYFNNIIKKASKKDLNYLLIIKKIYDMYILEKQSQGLIDFDDMIYIATKLVKENNFNYNYKYIIIDEYQDTSTVRENLVKEIKNKTKALLTVVGDDFQSIYRFSGCNLNNFLNFTKHFYPTKKLYLKNTYRNSQELIHVAGSFIMQNKNQIYKKLKSSKSLSKPLIILYYHDISKDFIKALKLINSPKLLILGRNNNDIYHVIDSKFINNNLITYDNNYIYYKTIHKAKGLEEDNVLIINLTNNINSLPTKIKDEHILKYVLLTKDIYPYEEERRLFYVALTRTKNYCYLFVNKNNPSIFIKELLNKYSKYIDIINL